MFRKLPRLLALLSTALLSQQAFAAPPACVNQNAPVPLEFCVDDFGRPAVWVQQPNGRFYQYFGGQPASWGSYLRVHTNGVAQNFHTSYIGGAEASTVTPVSNTHTGSGTASDPWVVTTVVALGTSGIRMTQQFRYVNGDRHIAKAWILENTGNTAYNDLRFFHGGDAYFGGTDSARSWYDADLRMLYLTNPSVQNYGYMAFFANPLTPISHYFGGAYGTGRSAIRGNAELPDQHNTNYVDAGYYLQWSRPTLPGGQSWRIEAFESWTAPGAVQVLAAGDEYTLAGKTIRKIFKIQNLNEAVAKTITWSVSSASGWTLAMPGSNTATLAPLQIVSVPVDVHVPAGAAAGDSAAVELQVSENLQVTGAGSSRLTVAAIDHTLSTRLLDFGTGVAEGEYAQMEVTFTNGASGVTLGEAGAGDPLAAPFAIVADTCSGVTLAPSAACTLTVRFSPATAAEFNDSFGLPVSSTVMVSETISTRGVSAARIAVDANAGAGGSISPASESIGPGRNALFTLTPSAGYRVGAVSGCGGTLAGNVYTTAPVTAACTVQAHFDPIILPVHVNATVGGSSSPAWRDMAYGSSATFTLLPDTGYRLAAVDGCDGTLAGDVYTTGAVNAACTVQARFERLAYALGTAAAPNGRITLSRTSVPHGDVATFVLTPDRGYAIGTAAGCPGALNGNTFTTEPITATCTLSATFQQAISPVTVSGGSKGGGGSTGLLGLGGLLLLVLRRLRGASALTLAGITAASGVSAGEAPAARLHAGATIGAATSSESGRRISAALNEKGHQVTASLDDSRAMWRVHGGWAINSHVAVEVGFSHLGEVSTSFDGAVPVLAVDALLEAASAVQPREATGFDLSLSGRYPLALDGRLALLGRTGLFRWSAERRITASDGRASVRYADGANLLLGAGLGLELSRHVEVSAEWMRYAMGGDSVQAAVMGIRYRW